MSTIVVTGMEFEARIARRAGLRAIVVGGRPEQRVAAIERALAEGATGLISFGIAGGLDPLLASGAILVPEAVRIDSGEEFPVDPEWRRRLLSGIPHAVSGIVLGAGAIVAGVNEKKSLYDRTNAVAVDLESGAVASAASRAGVPFVVVRAIADSAHRDLPHVALVGLDSEGRAAVGTVCGLLARKPRQIPALVRLTLETRRALSAIAAIAGLVGVSRAAPV